MCYSFLQGTEEESPPRKLYNPGASCFNKGETNVFVMAVPSDLGTVQQLQVWHNNEGSSPGWLLQEAKVRNYIRIVCIVKFSLILTSSTDRPTKR